MIAILVSGAILFALLVFSRRLEADRDRVMLCLLAQDGRPMYGLDLVTAGASVRGIIYVVLSDLEANGFVRRRIEPRYDNIHGEYGAPRSVYELTGAGRVVACDLRRGHNR